MKKSTEDYITTVLEILEGTEKSLKSAGNLTTPEESLISSFKTTLNQIIDNEKNNDTV